MRALTTALMSLALAWAAAPAWAQDEPRLALVIGNEAYPAEPGPLAYPARDAGLIARALEGAGFEVAVATDADRAQMLAEIAAFAERLRAAGEDAVGFFYYAGHGAVGRSEGRRRNFMLPARAEISDASQLLLNGVRLDMAVDAFESSGARAVFVVYDACRNEFSRGSRGFEPVSPRTGLLIAMSTAEGSTAPDDGRYAAALAAEIARPGQDALLAFARASQAVGADRLADEVPVVLPSLRGAFCFHGCGAAPSVADMELAAWEAAVALGTSQAFEDYLIAFEDGRFRLAAEAVLAALASEAEAVGDAAAGAARGGGLEPGQRAPGDVFSDALQAGGTGPEMIVLPAGGFTMGSPETEEGRRDDEGPRHDVVIARPFAVSRYEITYADWDACVAAGGCEGPASERDGPAHDDGAGRGRRPVNNVSWDDAQSYVRWLGVETGRSYRLMSEAEWEYAARAAAEPGPQTGYARYGWGDDEPSCDPGDANGAAASCPGETRAEIVGGYAPNAFGLFDMHGNVAEWTEDCYADDYRHAPSDGSAYALDACRHRVARGGARSPWWLLRSAARDRVDPERRRDSLGFRVAADLE